MKKSPNTTTAPTGNVAPFGLRMLPDLREKVERAAKASGRSMNAEIVARLDSSFSERDALVDRIALLESQAEARKASETTDQLSNIAVSLLLHSMLASGEAEHLPAKSLIEKLAKRYSVVNISTDVLGVLQQSIDQVTKER